MRKQSMQNHQQKVAELKKELAAKNRKLEVEAALERVRSVALRMKKPADMLRICRTISLQLQKLGVKEIRNVQTAVIYEKRGIYRNFEYYVKHKKTLITDVDYSDPLQKKAFGKILKERGAYAFAQLKGKKLKDWYKFQKTTNVFIDKYLETASSLNYYWYSLGPVALGISTYYPLTEKEKNLFKRFLNVFELAYRRYLDIEKAEAQAREAQIETALEKVRSRSLAMHKSDELQDLVNSVFDQLKELHIDMNSASIFIFEEGLKDWQQWVAASETAYSTYFHIPYSDQQIVKDLEKARQAEKDFFTIRYSYEEKNKWFDYAFKHTDYRKILEKRKKYIKNGECMIISFALSKNTGIQITKYHGEKFSDKENEIVKRIAKVFEQAYVRFLDLKKSETQAREAEIQLALERVRARTMAMHKSNELADSAAILFQQMIELGVTPERLNICLIKEADNILEVWATDQKGSKISHHFNASLDEPTTGKRVYDAWKEKKKSVVIDLSGKELNDWIKYVREVMGMTIKAELVREHRIHSVAFFEQGLILTTTPEPLPKESIKLLERFADVFNLTYTRFLDLQKAEAQAREAQIEAALERVRSLALGMRKSEEVGNVTDSFFNEFNKLSVDVIGCSIVVIDEDKDTMELWRARSNVAVKPFESSSYNKSMNISKKYLPQLFPKFYSALKERKNHLIEEMSSNIRLQFINTIAEQYNYSEKEKSKLFEVTPEKISAHFLFFKLGYLALIAEKKLPDENLAIARRFIEAFAFAYTRFLDIKKAEAQAREAQFETALERVRSRSMGMHESNELKDVVRLLYKEFRILVTDIDSVNIQLNPDSSKDIHFWASVEEDIYPELYHLPCSDLPIFEKFYSAFNSPGEGFFDYLLDKEEKDAFFSGLFKIQPVPPQRKKMIKSAEGMVIMGWFHKYSGIDILRYNLKRFSEEEKEIVKRFAAAFEQTYTRFLDLQKAEAQAREVEIQLALERVRARTMAMQHSNELSETASIFFKQLSSLGIETNRLYIGIFNDDSGIMESWGTTEDGSTISSKFSLDSRKNSSVKKMYEGWKAQKRSISIDMHGKELLDYIQYISQEVRVPVTTGYSQHRRVQDIAYFSKGLIGLASPEPQPDENINLLERFAKVFDQTYTRFLDLQKAEAQTREAIKQASLDRVRGEIASMRTSEDLNRITPLIWHELEALEVPFIRCGVFIVDEEKSITHVYLTTPEGKSLGVLSLSFDANELTINTVEYWKRKQVYREHWNKEEFITWTKSMMKLGQVQNAQTYQGSSAPPESLNLHFIPFTQGMLYVGDVSPLTDEKLDLVKTLAEAFSIAYARYEDFKNLEEAKNKIETTLSELKSAQTQLIHAEKLASLGELTAGIAHEIKNPLNFVNNFSEISSELLDEIKEELEKNDKEEVLALLEDLKQNLEKINHHGKRADSIVKGMLLHSRGTSGEKTPIDINDLLDQYVNLAYHGMRAQNKEFNITIEKNYDESLEKINVVPQDISRVFLNIINNACYAANERKKMAGDDFQPTLKVATKNLNDKVEIRIADNGNGIPENIKDKIFQPFFTTKPTGEGTGLGLSLSYDIVTKAHGGELKVETKESNGTTFIIQIPG